MNMYVEALLRTLLSIVVIFVLARLNGAKQVSQLTFYDYIVGISAGSISAAMCIEEDIDIWVCLIGVTIFMLSSLFFSVLTSKSIILRRCSPVRRCFSSTRAKSVTTACVGRTSISTT